jgi:hypothetical protein
MNLWQQVTTVLGAVTIGEWFTLAGVVLLAAGIILWIHGK